MKVIAFVLPLFVDAARIVRKHLENAIAANIHHHEKFEASRCGVSGGDCQQNWDYLHSIGSRGSIKNKYGTECNQRRQCQLSLKNAKAGMDKDPSLCDGAAFYLWYISPNSWILDEDNEVVDNEKWNDPKHSAAMWVRYADKFKQQLLDRRASGMKVTSPTFSDYTNDQLKLFFDHCQDCDNPNSHRYIELIHKTESVRGYLSSGLTYREATVPEMKDKVHWIKTAAQAASSQNGNRKVWLTVSCALCDADKHVDAIKSSGMFDFDGVVTAVFYDVRVDKEGRSRNPYANRYGLEDMAPRFGQTIGEALVEKCEGNSTKGCCSFWNDECIDPANEWCNASPSQCSECKGKWLGSKPLVSND